MSMDIVKGVTILGYVMMIAGICSLGYGLYIPASEMNVSHVTEFNQTYADNQTSEPFSLVGTEENESEIEPLEVHVTVNESEIGENNSEALREIIGTNESAIIDRPNELSFDRFIVGFGEDNYQVYDSVPDSLTQSQLSVGGIIMIFTGFLITANMRAGSVSESDGIVQRDDGEWEYYVDDEDL